MGGGECLAEALVIGPHKRSVQLDAKYCGVAITRLVKSYIDPSIAAHTKKQVRSGPGPEQISVDL